MTNRTNKTTDQILYGDGVYISALPCLAISAISDALERLVDRFINRSGTP